MVLGGVVGDNHVLGEGGLKISAIQRPIPRHLLLVADAIVVGA